MESNGDTEGRIFLSHTIKWIRCLTAHSNADIRHNMMTTFFARQKTTISIRGGGGGGGDSRCLRNWMCKKRNLPLVFKTDSFISLSSLFILSKSSISSWWLYLILVLSSGVDWKDSASSDMIDSWGKTFVCVSDMVMIGPGEGRQGKRLTGAQ